MQPTTSGGNGCVQTLIHVEEEIGHAPTKRWLNMKVVNDVTMTWSARLRDRLVCVICNKDRVYMVRLGRGAKPMNIVTLSPKLQESAKMRVVYRAKLE